MSWLSLILLCFSVSVFVAYVRALNIYWSLFQKGILFIAEADNITLHKLQRFYREEGHTPAWGEVNTKDEALQLLFWSCVVRFLFWSVPIRIYDAAQFFHSSIARLAVSMAANKSNNKLDIQFSNRLLLQENEELKRKLSQYESQN